MTDDEIMRAAVDCGLCYKQGDEYLASLREDVDRNRNLRAYEIPAASRTNQEAQGNGHTGHQKARQQRLRAQGARGREFESHRPDQ